MSSLVLRAYIKLIEFDFCLARRDFAGLYDKVRRYPIASPATSKASIEQVCFAVDLACLWYRKQVLCLQRSAATTCLLRSHGVPAKMVIGAQQMPFKAHAWVEVNQQVVNDKPYTSTLYAVLDKC
jgi:hypothetical protein